MQGTEVPEHVPSPRLLRAPLHSCPSRSSGGWSDVSFDEAKAVDVHEIDGEQVCGKGFKWNGSPRCWVLQAQLVMNVWKEFAKCSSDSAWSQCHVRRGQRLCCKDMLLAKVRCEHHGATVQWNGCTANSAESVERLLRHDSASTKKRPTQAQAKEVGASRRK